MLISLDELFDDVFQSSEYCVFIDETWATRQSAKYKSKLRYCAKTKNYFELQVDGLTEEGVLSELAQFKVILHDQSAYRQASNWLEKKVSGVMVFHDSHLFSAEVLDLVSRTIRYAQRKGLNWKFVFLGKSKDIDSLKVDQLFIEKFYPNKLAQSAKIKKPLAIVTCLICLVVLMLVFSIKPDQHKPLEPVDLNNVITVSTKQIPAIIDSARSPQVSLAQQAAPSAELLALIRKSEQRDLEFKGLLAETDSQDSALNDLESNDDGQITQSPVLQPKVINSIVNQLPEQAEAGIRNNDLTTVQEILISNDLRLSENERGETPLIIAANMGNHQIVEWLLTQNVSVNSRDRFGRTAIFYTAINGDDALLERLLKAGATAGISSNLSKTPLMAAVNNNHFATAQLLLAHSANIDAVDHSGWSAIFYAVWNSNINMMTLLLDNGASTTIADNSGLSLKQIAQAKGELELVDLL